MAAPEAAVGASFGDEKRHALALSPDLILLSTSVGDGSLFRRCDSRDFLPLFRSPVHFTLSATPSPLPPSLRCSHFHWQHSGVRVLAFVSSSHFFRPQLLFLSGSMFNFLPSFFFLHLCALCFSAKQPSFPPSCSHRSNSFSIYFVAPHFFSASTLRNGIRYYTGAPTREGKMPSRRGRHSHSARVSPDTCPSVQPILSVGGVKAPLASLPAFGNPPPRSLYHSSCPCTSLYLIRPFFFFLSLPSFSPILRCRLPHQWLRSVCRAKRESAPVFFLLFGARLF